MAGSYPVRREAVAVNPNGTLLYSYLSPQSEIYVTRIINSHDQLEYQKQSFLPSKKKNCKIVPVSKQKKKIDLLPGTNLRKNKLKKKSFAKLNLLVF